MSITWRRFQFFDKDPYTDEDGRSALSALNEFPDISTSCSASRFLVFGSPQGIVRVLNREYNKLDFQAHEGELRYLHLLNHQPVLVSIGIEEGESASLKLWSMERVDVDRGVAPVCLKKIMIFSSKFPVAYIDCASVLEDLSQIAIGLGNGQIIIIESGGTNTSLIKDHKPYKQFYLIKQADNPIMAVHYREDDSPAAINNTAMPAFQPTLYVVTNRTVSTYYVKHAKLHHIDLDTENGGEADRTCLVPSSKKLVVARREAIYFFDVEEKGACFAFEGSKKRISWYQQYLIIVNTQEQSQDNKEQLSIYDLKNKFIAYQAKTDPIDYIMPAFSSLYTVVRIAASAATATNKHALLHYTEKELSAKLDILFKKNLYPIAISLAGSSPESEKNRSVLLDIYQLYGDHCYSKGDYDGAITQYIETIGYTEPSYVIRKFLDAQRIQNLTKYLQALHEAGRANSDHTTLLLNCYTKLKEVDKLDEFVHSEVGWKFDVATAITVCRQAGYTQHALYLAQRHAQHELYLKIQLDDCNNSKEALKYIASLAWSDADRFITEYGKKLVTDLPDQTTQLLIALCTQYTPTPLTNQASSPSGGAAASTACSSAASSSAASSSAAPPPPANEKSDPSHFIHFFVDFPHQLQFFLESVQHETKHSTTMLYNTLLELYLRRAEEAEHMNPPDTNTMHTYHSQAMQLLKTAAGKYDIDHALVLAKLYHFEKAILYLYAKLSLYNEILQHHCEQKQSNKIIHTCKKYGNSSPQLWIQSLIYFATLQTEEEDGGALMYEEEIKEILENIERYQLLAPLMVIQILSGQGQYIGQQSSSSSSTEQKQPDLLQLQKKKPVGKPLAVIQEYLLKFLNHERNIINADSAEILRYQHDTNVLRTELQRLQTQPIIFQSSKCHQCGGSLNLPAVHFLCMHSYHLKCIQEANRALLSDDNYASSLRGGSGIGEGLTNECPRCAPEYRKVKEIKESMAASAKQPDRFFKQLDDSADGFQTVAEYFGRGVFGNTGSNENGAEE